MAVSIFTSQEPIITNAADSSTYSLGTKWFSNAAGIVTHGRWWFPDTAPTGPVDWVLYDVDTQAELGRATFGTSSPGWQTVALDPPVAYPTPATVWLAVVETTGRYVATNGLFGGGAIVNSPLTAPADGTNGRVGVGSGFPTGSFSDTCYFADIVFAVDAGSAAPNGLAVPIALGEPALSQPDPDAVNPDGLPVPVTLGQPTLTWAGAVFPTSAQVPVQHGDPTTAWSGAVTPSGLAVPMTLGAASTDGDTAPTMPGIHVAGTTRPTLTAYTNRG